MDRHSTMNRLREKGFGLVEIMIGLAIGLICMVVIMQVSSVFENQRRATTSGSDAQTNGATALYLMEREIRAAGNGMTEGEPQKYPPLAGCLTRVYDAAATAVPNPGYLVPAPNAAANSNLAAPGTATDIRLSPVVASDGGGGLPDSLTITYGTAVIAAPYTLLNSFAPGANSITLASSAGIRANDMVALVETNPALTPATPSGRNYLSPGTCLLLQATAVASPTVTFATGTRYNRAGGTLATVFSDEARLYNLGQLSLVTYRIGANNLIADTTRFGVTPNAAAGTAVVNRTDFSPLASNIVNMQVQYGVDTGNPGGAPLTACKVPSPGTSVTTAEADAIVDAWVEPTGIWANDGVASPSLLNLRRIRAVRIGLVARSTVKEANPAGDAACTTTTNPPTIAWDAGPVMAVDLSTNNDWRCYRYKVFQTTIPVRNALWSSTLNPASSASCGVRDPA